MVWLRLFFVSVFSFYVSSSWALQVLTSVKPIQMMAYELTKGVGTADVLLQNNTSPHDYSLRPSDVKKIRSADLVIWFGEGLEPFLTKILDHQASSKVLTISQLPAIHFRHFEAGHVDDGHHHGSFDPHFWLGVDVAKEVAREITKRLIDLDDNNRAIYTNNLASFIKTLQETDRIVAKKLSPIKSSPYYVFHDAYGYFEKHYHMNNQGHFTVSPERKPGAKTLVHIRKSLAGKNNICVFSEPQFQPAVIESVIRGTNAHLGTLDPLGSSIEVKDGSYFELLMQLANSFEQCLKR
jgi:zinc transport system substrate-binding protein